MIDAMLGISFGALISSIIALIGVLVWSHMGL